MHRVHYSSRAGGTVLSLQTSMSLTRNMNEKVFIELVIELYYIFSKIRNLDTGNFSLTLSILYSQHTEVQEMDLAPNLFNEIITA